MPPMVGQISLFPYKFAPAGWIYCDGALLPISENETLFQLIGFKFGGDGENTFGLPNIKPPTPDLHFCMSLFGVFNPNYYEALIGETMITPAPLAKNLLPCNGQLVSKSQYALLNLYMGTRFGGDGSNLALPTLKSTTTGCQYMIAVSGDPPDNLNARNPFLGQILLLPYQQSIQPLMLCNGASLPIAQYTALYSLIGTTFGGTDTTFQVPNLTSVAPAGYSYYIVIGRSVFPPHS
ncbi:MAG TPA: tail fiber protein [Pyrinomonadaceae bacterium]|nr:tail fiber protein [Pyrinomonadaceae bacterium]